MSREDLKAGGHPSNTNHHDFKFLAGLVVIGKMLVPLGWYPGCLTPQGAL